MEEQMTAMPVDLCSWESSYVELYCGFPEVRSASEMEEEQEMDNLRDLAEVYGFGTIPGGSIPPSTQII